MKLITILACIALFIPTVYGQGKYTIEGNIRNMPDTVPFSLSVSENGVIYIADGYKAQMIRGKFDVTQEIEKLTRLSFTCDFGKPGSFLDIWVRPGTNIRITGDNENLLSWKIESDIPEQAEYNRFRSANLETFTEIGQAAMELTKYIRKARAGEEAAKAKVDSIKQEVNRIEGRITQNDLDVMKENPIGMIGLEKLERAVRTLRRGQYQDRNQIVAIYNRLTEEQKQTDLGKKITASVSATEPVKVGDPMADADLKDLNGNTHRLADYKGEYILLDFWGNACGPCRASLPELKTITETYKGRLTVVSVSVDVDKEWKKASEGREIIWVNLSDGLGQNGLAARYSVFGLPAYALISPEGVILDRWGGYSKDSLIKKLEEYIK